MLLVILGAGASYDSSASDPEHGPDAGPQEGRIPMADSGASSPTSIAAETVDVEAAGGEIVEIRPDAESGAAFVADAMDSSRQPVVFEAGLRQGRAAASDMVARRLHLSKGRYAGSGNPR
jgi:hypothetical protein